MSQQVEIRILKLVDVDSFGTSAPFVRATAPSGEMQTSATGHAEKDPSKYTFSTTSNDNTFRFQADSNPASFAIAVFSKDESGQIAQYPGVGTINIFLDDENNDNTDIHCPLYEDGDEMLEIGSLIYSFNLVNNEGAVEPAQAEFSDIDFNAASLEPTPRLPVEPVPTPNATPQREASKPTPKPTSAPPFETMDSFDREMLREENMDQFLNDDAGNDSLYDINSLGPNEELIVAPELHIHPEHAHLDHSKLDHLQHQHDHDAVVPHVVPNVVHNVTLLPVPKPMDMRDWMRVAEAADNLAVADTVRADLAKVAAQCSKIIIRLHSVIVSSERALDTTSVTAKLSVQPLPNKVVSLRSVTNKGDEAGPLQVQTDKGTSTTFSFGLKTAQLSMGAGDLRSKTFREGACPRLCLEISLGGGESYTAFTELYLPSLLSDCSGQVLSVPLVQSCRNDGDHNSATLTSTLLFELNPADMVTANPAESPTPRNGTTAAAATANTSTSPGKKSKNKTQAAEVKTGLIPNLPSAMNVEVELSGVCGAALEAFPELTASASVEAYLTSSGCTETISLKNVATVRNSTAAVSIKKTFYLHSARPKVDILQLRLRNGPFPEDEIGRVCIPLVAFLQTESDTLLLNRPVAFNAWKFSNSDKGGAYLLGNWKLVGALRYQSVGPSASQKVQQETSANANLLCTTTEDLESLQYSPGNTDGRSNWLSSPTRRSPGFETQATGTAVPSSAKPSLVKSVSGQLVGCIKGYFSARSGLDATGNQEREGPFYLSKGYSLCVETTLMPEGLRKKTVLAPAMAQQSGDIEATVEWGKSFSMFLAYAAQQRPVPYLQVNLYAEKTTVAAAPAKNYAKTLIGSCIFDASCLLTYTDAPLVKCLLPLTRAGVNPSFTVLNKADVCGWLAVGFQFRPASAGGDVKADMDLAEAAMQAQWTSLSAFSTQYCLGLSAYADPNSVATIKALQTNPNKLQNGSLHVALSTLQFAAQTGSSNVQADWEDSEVTCVVKVGSDPDSAVQISGAIQNDQVAWFKPDAVMKFTRESSTSVCLFVYLLRGRFDPAMTDASTVVAAANLTLSQDQLQKGLPINFTVPLRDTVGERSATLGLSVQLTTIGDSADLTGAGDATSTFAPSATATNNNAQSPVPLRIEFCEGNIADSDDHMEPFFECSLLLPEHEELLAGPAYSTKARTGFLRLSDNLEYWGLDCTLHVPPASVASINTATATMLATNRSIAAANSANLNSGVCIMGVVCRDASKQGCPEIGWARVALPRQLILQGKPVEQWVSLTPPSRSGASGSPVTPPVGGKHSRMKLRISVDYKDYDAAYCPFGLGAVMFRVIGVHDARAGVNDDLVSARVSSYSWPDGTPTDVLDLKEDNMFAQLNAHPAAYINEMSIFNEENLVGSLPVSGGFGEVKLSVKTFTTNTSYMASFPIMAATTKATESNELPAIPQLSLNLSRERVAEMVSKDGTQRPARARLEPQLQVMAAYVPYVTGKLVLHCTDVTMVTPPAETIPAGTVLKNVASPLAIRYLLGNNSSRFMFSRSFELSATDAAGKPKPLQGPPALNQVDNVTFMEVNTFEIISNSIRRGENFSMLPLFVSLLEQWDLLDPAVGQRGQQSCVGIGYVSTAALYYQALRAAASTPMKPQPPSAASQAGGATTAVPAGGALSSTAIAASPWLVSKVDIFDPKSKLKVAVISLNIQFVMSGLPEHVARMLSNTVSKSLGDASAKARIELGLKQSFVLADVDKSGAVSSAELLQVINNSGRANARGRTTNKSGRLMATQKGETIGMENAVDLLFHLANVSEAEMNAVDEQSLNDLVRKIFAQLDVDGDGLVSWWEWKCVLCASILGHNSASKFMYHLDALVIGAQAANDALKTLSLTLPAEDNYDSKASAQHSMLPYIKLKMKTSDNLSEPVIYEEDDGLLTPELQPSKTVSRLHSMVKSLRLTNSILAKRFERALSTAQNLSIDLEQDALQHSASKAGAGRQGAKLSEIEYLEARIHDTEKQSEQNLSSFLTAKERADRLSAQLLEMKSTADIMEQSRSKPELFAFNAQLEQEIAANAEKLRIAQQMRKQRSSEIFSAFRLKAMISKFLMPKVYQRRRDKAAAQLAHVLQSQAVRRNYLAEKEKRKQAALVLQGAGRGLLGRKRVKEMNQVATKTQNLFRGKMARRTLANLKEQKAQRDAAENLRKQQIKLNMASFVITRFVRNCAHRNREEKNSAAIRLQGLLKKRLNFKAAKKVVNEKRADRDVRHAEERRLAEELARMTEAEKLRAEEENRRQEAAKKLTRALSMRSGLVEGRKIHAFLAAQNGLRQIERPEIPDIAGSWVGYPQSMSTHPADSTEAQQSSFLHFGRGNFGNIQKVDARTRIMDVLFLYNKVEGASSKSGAKFELEKLPYDHPLLDFYTNEPLPKPDQGYWVPYAQEGEHHWLPFKPFTDRPDLIEDTLGYKVGLRADAHDEGALYPGRIVAFDRAKGTVCILFDAGDPNDEPDQEDVHWKSEDIQWLMPATVSRPKTIEEAVGFNVEVNKAQSTVEAHRAVRGTVIGFDKSRQTVRVVYAPPPGLTEATEVENLEFVSPTISWLNMVPLDQLPRSPRPNNAASGPSFSKLIATTRPTDILATVGHLVEVQSTDPDAEPGDMFSGVVIAADSRAGTVRVLYDSSDGRNKQHPDGTGGQGADAPDEEEDYEDLPWMSPDILWVVPETNPIIPNIDGRRPHTLGDAVGLHVDVLSHEPDAVDGDYFSGVVISVDNARQTIRVLFDGEDNGDDDYEDIPWNSQDIHWLTEESLRGRDALSLGDSVSLIGPAQDANHRPTTVTEAVGRTVKVGAEFMTGEVVSVDTKSAAVWVVFNTVANAPAPVQVKIHWKSPHIEWLDSKSLAPTTPTDSPGGKASAPTTPVAAAAPAAAPASVPTAVAGKKLTQPVSLATSVGWTVEIRASEAEDEVYVGEVAGFDEATQMLKVLFAGEDGALQPDDAEYFAWGSEQLHWAEAPAAQSATPGSAVSGGAAPAAAGPSVAAPVITSAPAENKQKPASATVVISGEPSALEQAVGRNVNIVLDYVSGQVDAVSQALQTVNVLLEHNQPGATDSLVIGLPLASPMIEWDARK